jgi:hypothetical protein
MARRTEGLCCRMIGPGIGAQSAAGHGLATGMAAGVVGVSPTGLPGLWAARANEDRREVFRIARKQIQADLRFVVLFSGSGRLQRAYHAKPVQAGGGD